MRVSSLFPWKFRSSFVAMDAFASHMAHVWVGVRVRQPGSLCHLSGALCALHVCYKDIVGRCKDVACV